MKKLITILLSVMLALNLVACGSQSDKNNEQTSQSTNEDTAPETEQQPSEVQSGKTLVVYYSATGNTKEVAGYIADATGADTFELVPAEPYTSEDLDWTNEDSRVSREHDNPDERVVELVETTVSDWEAYDTIYIGYPIWWGIAAWPMDGFITANDFTGKTVIPFCTSSSSDLGESGKLLEEAAGTGNWLEGHRFRSGVSEKDVKDWVAD
ncbi:flavodoxin [Sporofaciens sp. SGI.106]|uniref:flavodoxin n=1 Tax=Sporofaciens sp. SGI.106 TaxID=3420568 RepID=UPI002A9D8B06|nr:flavodoxin [Lachnoclostridium sp.]